MTHTEYIISDRVILYGSSWFQNGNNLYSTSSKICSALIENLDQYESFIITNPNDAFIYFHNEILYIYGGLFFKKNIFFKISKKIVLSEDITHLITPSESISSTNIYNYLFTKGWYFNSTPFDKIQKVSNGLLCSIDTKKNLVQEKYLPILRGKSRHISKTSFNNILQDVFSPLKDKKLMSTLSGGLDSSFVTSYLKRNISKDIKAFHIYHSDGYEYNNELNYARYVAKDLDVELIEIDFNFNKWNSHFIDYLSNMPLPVPNSGYRYYLLSKSGVYEDIDYFVSGDAADTLFELDPKFYYFSKMKLLNDIAKPYAMKQKRYFSNYESSGKIYKITQSYLSYLLRTYKWKGTSIEYYQMSKIFKNIDVKNQDLPYEIKTRNMYALSNNQFLLQTYFPYLELPYFHAIINDHFNSQYFTPFLDTRLINACLSLNPSYTRRKRFLKEIASDYLPQHLIHRSKMGLNTPFQKWLLQDLAFEVKRVLLSGTGMISRGIFNENAFRSLFQKYIDSNGKYWCEILALFSLEIWLKLHLDKKKNDLSGNNIDIKQFVEEFYK
jgi:asparagine synthetase B (glutamine-hydrolysing)